MPESPASIGNRIAPWRFLLFLALLIAASTAFTSWIGWRLGVMAGFDTAAAIFLLSCIGLLSARDAATIRDHAASNDANRLLLLAVTGIVMIVVLVTVGAELSENTGPAASALVIATLLLAWLLSNIVYAFHYAHLYYLRDEARDRGGIVFPKTAEPDYWDFVYFAFTIGMTFQTSDAQITSGTIRRIATVHSFVAFLFNLGVLAFTINVLGN
jgi:uncharacterized membrane protein